MSERAVPFVHVGDSCPPTQDAFDDTEVTSSHHTEVTLPPPHISSILHVYIRRACKHGGGGARCITERWRAGSKRSKRKDRAGSKRKDRAELQTDRRRLARPSSRERLRFRKSACVKKLLHVPAFFSRHDASYSFNSYSQSHVESGIWCVFVFFLIYMMC